MSGDEALVVVGMIANVIAFLNYGEEIVNHLVKDRGHTKALSRPQD